MKFPLVSIGSSANTILEANKSAVFGFGKRAAGQKRASKARALLAERTAPQILAITVPLAAAFTSMTWAIVTYLMVRERYRAEVEQARIEAEVYKAGYRSKEPALEVEEVENRAIDGHPVH